MASQGNNGLGMDSANGDYFSTIPTFDSLQLDIVGFLAILGEGSVLANAQVSTLSKWIFLPRLLPAPQALLRPSRPEKLEQAEGYVTGVVSGNHREKLNHIGNIVLDTGSMKEFDVRCVEIQRKAAAPIVKAKALSYLTGNTMLGCAFSIAILILSVIWEDGMALIAVCSLSLLSTLIGLGNYWKLKLPQRKEREGDVPRGDVVIRHPKGSFLVVKCDEDVAREIFFAPENIEYLIEHQQAYRLLSLAGSMMLMAGVICLANAQVKTQTCFAAAYMFLNAAYWIVAAFPAKVHWDTSAFKVKKERLDSEKNGDKHFTDKNGTFTQALWKVIVATKGEVGWVRLGGAAPDTPGWNAWLEGASHQIKAVREKCELEYTNKQGTLTYKVPNWDPQKKLAEYMRNPSRDHQLIADTPMEEVEPRPPASPRGRNPTAANMELR